jgi:ribosomal subunit interface protein
MPDPSVTVSFKDVQHSDRVQEEVERRCGLLAAEFPETTKFEITLAPEGSGFTAHAHVTGRDTEVAAHGAGNQLGEAANRLLDKLERALRKAHDKKIFKNRREAKKFDAKRNAG